MALSAPSSRISPKKRKYTHDTRERITIGEYLLKRLDHFKLRHIFSKHNYPYKGLKKLIEHHPHINYIKTIEAISCAIGYAQIRPISVLLTTKTELKNNIGSIETAFVESIPLLVVISTKEKITKKEEELSLFGTDEPTYDLEYSFEKLFKKLFCYYSSLDNPDIAAKKIDRAIDSCLHYQKPVCLQLPEKLVNAFIPPHQARQTMFTASDPENFRDVYRYIRNTVENEDKICICLGREVVALKATEYLVSFAEKIGASIMTTLLSKTAIDEHHPLFIGTYCGDDSHNLLIKTMNEADVLLFFGVPATQLGKIKPTAIINDQETFIGPIRSPHVALYDLLKQLALSSYPDRPKTTLQKNILPHRRQIKAFEGILEELSDELLVVANRDILLQISTVSLPKKTILSSHAQKESFALAAGFGAKCADQKRSILVLLTETELQHSLELLNSCIDNQLPLVVILFSNNKLTNNKLDYSQIPNLFKAGCYTHIQNAHELKMAYKTSKKMESEFFLIEVSI